jgi:hypothetical protein
VIAAFKQYINWDVLLMLVLFGVIGTLEMVGVFNRHFITITAIIRASIPRPFRWMILGWLTYHFGVE